MNDSTKCTTVADDSDAEFQLDAMPQPSHGRPESHVATRFLTAWASGGGCLDDAEYGTVYCTTRLTISHTTLAT